MDNVHHADATTTVRIRKEIQDSPEPTTVLAARYHIPFQDGMALETRGSR